jgi:hypothetical protein
LLALLSLYGTASAFFARRAAADGGLPVVVALVLAFASMHLSWGISLLIELVRGRPARAVADDRPAPSGAR